MSLETNSALQETATLVLKHGVSLGLLDGVLRHRVLALAWQCLPHGVALTESQVNVVLRGFVDQAGAFLRADHVELRRWLVDTGWLSRDGFGREYRAAGVEALAAPYRDAALPLAGLDVNAWAQSVRERSQAEALRRRLAWSERQRDAAVAATHSDRRPR